MNRKLSLMTKDNEVMDINAVQIELTEIQEHKVAITLAYINTEIARLTSDIQQLQTRLSEFQVLRIEVATLADNVILRKN